MRHALTLPSLLTVLGCASTPAPAPPPRHV